MTMSHFDKSKIYIAVPSIVGLGLRAIGEEDLMFLRQWKNQQKQFFFHQQDISPEQQMQWFESFVTRPHDLLFMTVYAGHVFGCMGIRWLDSYWDIYNVILGDDAFGKRGLMGNAFNSLLHYALTLKSAPITLQVLKHNPAVGWYHKHGFKITEEYDNHFSMTYQKH
jgi:ribosomal protein S18 acetylase RimI-like enzyme